MDKIVRKMLKILVLLCLLLVCFSGCENADKSKQADKETEAEKSSSSKDKKDKKKKDKKKKDKKQNANDDIIGDINDMDDGYAAPLEYNDEFAEIFEKLEGEWVSEDGLVCISFAYEGEDYNYSRYTASICDYAYPESGQIYRLRYDNEDSNLITIDSNTDIMQLRTEILLNESDNSIVIPQNYSSFSKGDLVYLYPYDSEENAYLEKLDAANYVVTADMAYNLQTALEEHNLDFNALRKTSIILLSEYGACYVYTNHVEVLDSCNGEIVLIAKCRTSISGEKYSTTDVDYIITLDKEGNVISIEIDEQ